MLKCGNRETVNIFVFAGFGGSASVALMYVNVLVNGLQGFFLFLLYCVNSRIVRRLILRKTFVGILKRPSGGATSMSAAVGMTSYPSQNGNGATATSVAG